MQKAFLGESLSRDPIDPLDDLFVVLEGSLDNPRTALNLPRPETADPHDLHNAVGHVFDVQPAELQVHFFVLLCAVLTIW